MSDAETKALARAAALLLAVSLARWGWARAARGPVVEAPDALAELIEESRAEEEEAAARARPLGEGERLDPNRATARELDRLPGVGPKAAAAIVEARLRDGAFRRPEDLARVRGIGPATVEKLREHLDLSAPPPAVLGRAGDQGRRRARDRARRRDSNPVPSGARDPPARSSPETGPIDVNRADIPTLQRLPGVGPALAARIIEARKAAPFNSVDELTRVRGIGPATVSRLRDRVTVGGRRRQVP